MAETSDNAQAAEEGKETILLTENDEAVKEVAHEVLQREGFRVIPASHGVEALDLAAKHSGPIHLLITDVVMPEMNGWELAEQLALRHPETRVLYMSGYADNAIIHEGIRDSDASFLHKPFTQDNLFSKVREALGKSDAC